MKSKGALKLAIHNAKISKAAGSIRALYRKALSNKEMKAIAKTWEAIGHTKYAHNVEKGGKAVGKYLKTNHKKIIKFSDLPKGMKAPWDEEDLDDEEIAVHFSKKARHYIGKNMSKIVKKFRKVVRSRKFRKVPKRFIRWVLTPAALRADGTEHFFWASKDGQALIKAWGAHMHNLRRFLRGTRDGFKFSNKNLPKLIKSKMALLKAFRAANHSKGARAVRIMWRKAMHTKQFGNLYMAMKAVCKSKQAKKLGKRIAKFAKGFKANYKKHITFTDLPKGMKKPWDEEEEEFAF